MISYLFSRPADDPAYMRWYRLPSDAGITAMEDRERALAERGSRRLLAAYHRYFASVEGGP